jgi:hypothetical protein
VPAVGDHSGNPAAGATPTWLLGSFAVLSLLHRVKDSADPLESSAEASAGRSPHGAEANQPGAEVLIKRAQAEGADAELSAEGTSPSESIFLDAVLSFEGPLRPPMRPGGVDAAWAKHLDDGEIDRHDGEIDRPILGAPVPHLSRQDEQLRLPGCFRQDTVEPTWAAAPARW